MTRTSRRTIASGLLLLPLLAGCGSSAAKGPGGAATASSPAATPAGTTAAGPPVTLRLGDAEAPGRSSQPWIDRFIDKVTADSGGTITIQPIYKAGGGNVDKPGEVIVAAQVIAGEFELALVPVRAWNDVGVTSLQALGAPLLIDSDALLTAVAADPLMQPLLDGMLEHGVVGLSAWPDDLRHPFAWEQNGPPFLNASDMTGATVWTFQSKLQTMILHDLGATPMTTPEIDAAVAAGSLRGAESSFNGIVALSGTPTATGDVVLFPKYQVLAAEDAAFGRLTPAQQAIIRDAATAARDLAIKDHVPDATIAQAWCKHGGRVVLAGPASLATFQQAAEPIVAKLAEDPLTATAIEAIRALKAGTPATTVDACEPPADAGEPPPSIGPGPDLGAIPDGVYIHMVTKAELVADGVDPTVAGNNEGKWTFTVQGDHGEWLITHPWGGDETISLQLELAGDRVLAHEVGGLLTWDLRWSLAGETMGLQVINSSDGLTAETNSILGGSWTKVE